MKRGRFTDAEPVGPASPRRWPAPAHARPGAHGGKGLAFGRGPRWGRALSRGERRPTDAGVPPSAFRLRHSAFAFTLVEVLVALVILSTGIVVVLEAFQTSLTALTRTREAMRMDMLGRGKLAEVQLRARADPPAAPVDSSGLFDGEDAAYAWSQRVDTGAPGENTGGPVFRVSVSVWRRDNTGGRRTVELIVRSPGEKAP